MERRFEVRMHEMQEECEVDPLVFRGMVERLGTFAKPFVQCLRQPCQQEHAKKYVGGLLSDLKRKNVESIAYRDDQDRRNLQHFIGTAPWDHRPLFGELASQVGGQLGEADGVIVFDPSAFPKKGKQSVGVARQWCGRLGKIDNCQVAVYMGYASRKEHALVDARLYLPKAWTSDRRRRKAAGVPKEVRFQTRHEQALEMLEEHGHALPHAWIAGDDEMGRSTGFRRDLHEMNETYLLAVPSNTTIRDLDAQPPAYQGRGAKPKIPFVQVNAWRDGLPKNAWTRIDVRDGEKGPLKVEIVSCHVQAKIERRCMKYEETLVIIRTLDEDGVTKYDYYLSNASSATPLAQFARVSKAAHRVEECIKRAKSEAGLADYEVRTWQGWHHHQILSLIATWFLVVETRRGKKMDTGNYRSPNSRRLGDALTCQVPMRYSRPHRSQPNPSPATKRAGSLLPLQST